MEIFWRIFPFRKKLNIDDLVKTQQASRFVKSLRCKERKN